MGDFGQLIFIEGAGVPALFLGKKLSIFRKNYYHILIKLITSLSCTTKFLLSEQYILSTNQGTPFNLILRLFFIILRPLT